MKKPQAKTIQQLTLDELGVLLANPDLFTKHVPHATDEQKAIGAEIFRSKAIEALMYLVEKFGTDDELLAPVEELILQPITLALQSVSVQISRENPDLTRDECIGMAVYKVKADRDKMMARLIQLLEEGGDNDDE